MYDVVIVGSGYGGSTMAARLSPHARVLLVERGRRWSAGEFPHGLWSLARSYLTANNPLGLWGMRLGRGTGNAFASALGGSSVVNYGITAKPEPHTFAGWPITATELEPYYARALDVLRPEPNPMAGQLGDQAFLDELEPGCRHDIVNTIDWSTCTQCGRCVPGCNAGAKRSLDRTYLALAQHADLELRVETEVRGFAPLPGGGWQIQLTPTDDPEAYDTVEARVLVLAAGTFGTLDLLQRHHHVLALSPQFGQRMSMNGDGLAFLYNTGRVLSSQSGAPITTAVRLEMRGDDGQPRTLNVMSGRLPMAIMRFTGAVMAVLGGRLGHPGGRQHRSHRGQRAARRWRDLFGVRPGGALSQTFMYKLDGQDAGKGAIHFDDHGRSAVDWPDYTDDPIMRFAAQRLEQWAQRIGATVVRDLGSWPGMKSFGVHPLGGCRMGATVNEGVVDDRCRVFDPAGGVFPGLRVVDASVIPTSLGVPSSLTIAAIAERVADDVIAELRRSSPLQANPDSSVRE